MLRRLLAFCLLAWPGLAGAQVAPSTDLKVQAGLIADVAVAAPGQSFKLGLRQDIAPGWHTYWQNPGDSGAATTLDLDLPEDVVAGPIQWPAPEALPYAGLMNYGYEDEVLLAREVTLPETWPTGIPAVVRAEATWLVCADICIPESGSYEILVETGPQALPSADAAAFATTTTALPRPTPFETRFAPGDGSLRLSLDGGPLFASDVEAHFFPTAPGLVEAAAPQAVRTDGTALVLDLPLVEGAGTPEQLEGVLTLAEPLPDGAVRQAFTIDAAPGPVPAPSVGPSGGLAGMLALALLGGLILNLMPCVFPILSIKALHVLRHRGQAAKVAGIAYTAGVLATFGALGLLLVALKATGVAVGWGFQLQEPLVVMALAWLTTAIGLWLLTGYTIGASLMGLGGGLSDGPLGSFLTGCLAVVVAAPCTAPFMAGALGFALTQSAFVALLVFLALGLGLALPFLLLSFVPALQRLMPRPGAWMERFRQALAFPMLATSAWLVWVLGLNAGGEALLAGLLGLVVLGFAFWLGGLDARPARALALAAALASLVLPAVRLAGPGVGVAAATEGVTILPPAEPFAQSRLDALRADGRPVFVNMTAAWCLTCLVNERVALAGPGFEALLDRSGAAYLKGDWTRQDPAISAFLDRFGRSGVPLYAVFPPKGAPELLPQLLTPAIVEAALARAEPP